MQALIFAGLLWSCGHQFPPWAWWFAGSLAVADVVTPIIMAFWWG